MAGGRVVTPYDQVDRSNFIDLKKFPPILRKLGKHLLENDNPGTIDAICKELNLNIHSVYQSIYRTRKKGNDFLEFINQETQSILQVNKLSVLKSVADGAVSHTSTAHNQQKLFFQLSGDLKEANTNVNIGSLTIGINIGSLPADTNRSKGVIDTDPFIPGNKQLPNNK